VDNLNAQFLASAGVIGLGYLLKRTLIPQEHAHVLVRLVFNVTLPAVVITTFSTMVFHASYLSFTAICVAHGLLMALLGGVLLFRDRDRRERGLRAMLLPGFNIGLFAYPLVESTLGADALKYLGMFDVGASVVAFMLVYAMVTHFTSPEGSSLDLRRTLGSMARSVPLVAYLLALAVNVAGLSFPGPVLDMARTLARANMPLALLVIGMYLEFGLEGGRWLEIGRILGIRYAVGLAAGVTLYATLPFGPVPRAVVLLALVLPPPLICISYAVQFGLDHKFVGVLLNVANVISYFGLWAVLTVVTRL
jgi:malate permease and related proteins